MSCWNAATETKAFRSSGGGGRRKSLPRFEVTPQHESFFLLLAGSAGTIESLASLRPTKTGIQHIQQHPPSLSWLQYHTFVV
jgi:hypothetical protein